MVRRRARYTGNAVDTDPIIRLESPSALVSALDAECAVKEGAKAPIGFL